MLLLPFIMAFTERAAFGGEFPRGLWALLTMTLVGSLCVIVAQTTWGSKSLGAEGSSALVARDYAGMALQLISICFSAAARLTVRGTSKIATRHEMLVAQFGSAVFILGGATAVFDRASWVSLFAMDAIGWACLLFLGIGVYVVGQSLNVIVIRGVSATTLTSLSSLRLVVACATSYILLNEPVANWLQWLGIFIVLVSISAYVFVMVSDIKSANQNTTTLPNEEHGDADHEDDGNADEASDAESFIGHVELSNRPTPALS